MSLFPTFDKLEKIFMSEGNLFALAKIDLLVSGMMTAPMPSFALENDYLRLIGQYGLEGLSLDGIELIKTNFVNSVLYWGESKEAYCFVEKIKSYLLDIEPCTFVPVDDFYKIPKHGFYCEIDFDNYYGFLVSWDYYINSNENKVDFLNICLLAKEGEGKVISLELPKRYEIYDFKIHKDNEYWDTLIKVIGLIMYVVHERTDAEKTVKNGYEYFLLGKKFENSINEKENEAKGRKGHWRKGHFHLYWFVIKGVRTPVTKWVEPTWVSASKPKVEQKRDQL